MTREMKIGLTSFGNLNLIFLMYSHHSICTITIGDCGILLTAVSRKKYIWRRINVIPLIVLCFTVTKNEIQIDISEDPIPNIQVVFRHGCLNKGYAQTRSA